MLDNIFISVFVSTILGFLAGLGVGGGSLLILWLTLILDVPYESARITNLLFFLPSAGIVTFLRAKQRTISIQRIWPAIVAGCIGAVLIYMLSGYIQTQLLRKLFGVLLLFTAIRELFYRPRKAK